MRSFSKFAQIVFFGLLIVSAIFVVSCGGSGNAVLNKDKPLVFFNRQPSDPTTGEIDMT